MFGDKKSLPNKEIYIPCWAEISYPQTFSHSCKWFEFFIYKFHELNVLQPQV